MVKSVSLKVMVFRNLTTMLMGELVYMHLKFIMDETLDQIGPNWDFSVGAGCGLDRFFF